MRSLCRPTAAGPVLAALLLTGCGSGSDDAGGGPSPSGTSSPAPGLSPHAPSSVPSTTSAAVPTASPTASPAVTSAAPTVTPAAGSACRSLQTSVQPGAEPTDETLVFVNRGPSPCTLSGAPTVVYVMGNKPVGAPAARTGAAAPVPLAPGGSAHAALHVVDVRTVDRETCQASPVDGLRVVLPGQTGGTVVAAPGTTCADPSVAILTLGPVQAG